MILVGLPAVNAALPNSSNASPHAKHEGRQQQTAVEMMLPLLWVGQVPFPSTGQSSAPAQEVLRAFSAVSYCGCMLPWRVELHMAA